MKKAAVVLLAMVMGTAAFAAEFAVMDTDQDGALSVTEFATAYPDADEDLFGSIDTNTDGSLDEIEIAAAIDEELLSAE
ncbi:hypothetical protein GCM10008927_14370 [Amylibacter ulvae]|uniref:EF-hand domain-containing protein n=1 Tax=Paramylibacter ulvae TaxID=1651968 RepID=A0ABQ3D2Q0_9RHOB|nr:hypothetical protein GCM10008927_14370 [Amylibacter ulvae]